MSKKKNTLKDLDEFLRQQAASLVSPEKLTATQAAAVKETKTEQDSGVMSTQALTERLRLDEDRLMKLCELIIGAFESGGPTSPEEKMLINTALYLKNTENWKEAITEYWRARK